MFEIIQQWLQPYIGVIWPYFSDTWGAFNDYTYLQAAFLATMGYAVGRVLGRYLPEMLRSGLARFNLGVSDDVLALSRFPLFNLSFLSGLLLAVLVSDLNPAVAFALKAILKSTMIAVFAMFVYQLGKLLLTHLAHSETKRGIIQPQTLPLFKNAAMVFVLVGASHQIFAVWNVDMTALLASAGIAGLAIGMASKDMLADVIAGILIMTDRPFQASDIVQFGANKGKIMHIGIRSTRLLSVDNVEIIIPNSLIGNSQILNESSAEEQARPLRLEIATAYGVDTEQIRTILLEVAANNPDVLQDKPRIVHLLGFDKLCANFRLTCWVIGTERQLGISSSLRENVYTRFLEANIPLALPVREEVAITHFPDSRQEVAITQLPDSRQEIRIKEMPDSSRSIYVKEVPNLFGNNLPKKPDKTAATHKSGQDKPVVEEASS